MAQKEFSTKSKELTKLK